jgi:hypothetical protein
MAIGYLPLAVVRQNLQLLRTSRSTVRLCRRYHELQDFLNYFEMNYLNGNFYFSPKTLTKVEITTTDLCMAKFGLNSGN